MHSSHHAVRRALPLIVVLAVTSMASQATEVFTQATSVELETLLSQERSAFTSTGSTDLPEIALDEQQWVEVWDDLGFNIAVGSQFPLPERPEVDFGTFFVVGVSSSTCGEPQPAMAEVEGTVLTLTVAAVAGPPNSGGCFITGTNVHSAYAVRRDAVPAGEITVRLVITGFAEHSKTVTVREAGAGELPRTGADGFPLGLVAVALVLGGARVLRRAGRA